MLVALAASNPTTPANTRIAAAGHASIRVHGASAILHENTLGFALYRAMSCDASSNASDRSEARTPTLRLILALRRMRSDSSRGCTHATAPLPCFATSFSLLFRLLSSAALIWLVNFASAL